MAALHYEHVHVNLFLNGPLSFNFQENVRNVLIKDHMRDHCVPELVESWLWIMVMFTLIKVAVRLQVHLQFVKVILHLYFFPICTQIWYMVNNS